MRWVWVGWLLLFVATFAVFEGYALSRPDGLSLSQFVADVSYAWPPIVFLLGLTVGILVTHFWWPWIPKQRRETCQVCGKTILKS
jgi:hypothetical protein